MDRARDHIVQVTNGTVDSASRKTSGRNIRWVITETPDGDKDIVVSVSAATGYSTRSAVSTTGGRMMSNSISGKSLSNQASTEVQPANHPVRRPASEVHPEGDEGTTAPDGDASLIGYFR